MALPEIGQSTSSCSSFIIQVRALGCWLGNTLCSPFCLHWPSDIPILPPAHGRNMQYVLCEDGRGSENFSTERQRHLPAANKPEGHPLENKPEKSYACPLSLFFSWDPSPQKGDFTPHRAGLQKTCQLPHAAPTPLTLLHHIHPPVPTCSNQAGAAHFIPVHWVVAELHSHLWLGRLTKACLGSLSPPHPSTLSSPSSAAAGGEVCPV